MSKQSHNPRKGGRGVSLHLIKNPNYLCIVCSVCLFGLLESFDRDQGGVVDSLTPEFFTSSLSSAISLSPSHLAVKWSNVFKALFHFIVLSTSSRADVCRCSLDNTACYCSWKTPLMKTCVAWSLVLKLAGEVENRKNKN